MNIVVKDVPYINNVADVFARFAHLPWAIYLDSGRGNDQSYTRYGRYDIISAYPKKTFLTYGKQTIVNSGGVKVKTPEDPFVLLLQELNRYTSFDVDLPFSGGALGLLSYDIGRRVEHMPQDAIDDIGMPDMAIGIYCWAYVVDHVEQKATLVGDLAEHRVRMHWDEIVDHVFKPSAQVIEEPLLVTDAITSNMSEAEYKQKFASVKDYIQAGDCYQVNLAQRFSAQVRGDPWSTYVKMREINPSPFSAYMNVPGCNILSASPERFLKVKRNKVETKPIKGTRPRSNDADEEQRIIEELTNSLKDRAENVMIVDLLRNDLSKCCVANSVQVPKLFDLESFPTVHHLVSTVTGELRENSHALHLLRACFPGGSITGAPKIRAMEIIEELEPHRRALYCGAMGYIDFNGDMDTNIAIRTLVHKDGRIYFYAGGGLVWDSDPDAEYQETFDKAAAMFKLFEQA